MAVFYTVDRSGSLSEGLTIDLYNENESFVYNCNIGGCSKPFSLSGSLVTVGTITATIQLKVVNMSLI